MTPGSRRTSGCPSRARRPGELHRSRAHRCYARGQHAYNLSAHGPIIPLGSPLLALTPVSPFRPRRWRGALLPDTVTVVLENLGPARRQLAATADFRELTQVQSMTITQDRGNAVTLLFDADGSLEERFVAEQFLS